jgi:hypothetical protein
MSFPENKELESLRRRVSELEARVPPSPRRRWLGALAVVAAALAGTAFGANGACPNGLPFCFTADSPALASEVNHNFSQLKEWLEAKVGPTSTSTVTAGTINATTLTTSGAVVANSVRIQQGTTSNVTAAGTSPFFVSGVISDGTANSGGFEFRHDNLTQGIGLGFNTIYATGSSPSVSLQLKAKGSGTVNVLGDLSVSGSFGGGSTVLQGTSGASTVTASCPGGKRVLFAMGWTNDSNTACTTNDRQTRCAIPVVLTNCNGQTICSYTGQGNGCGNPGNSCISLTCL